MLAPTLGVTSRPPSARVVVPASVSVAAVAVLNRTSRADVAAAAEKLDVTSVWAVAPTALGV